MDEVYSNFLCGGLPITPVEPLAAVNTGCSDYLDCFLNATIDPLTGKIFISGTGGNNNGCVLVITSADIVVGHGELLTGTFHPNFGNPLLPNGSRFVKILRDTKLIKVNVQLYGTSTADVILDIRYAGGASISSFTIPAGTDASIDSGVISTDLIAGDKLQIEVIAGDSDVAALVTFELESNSCTPTSTPAQTFSEFYFTTNQKVLANGQSDISDYNVPGVLLGKSTSLSLSSDISSNNYLQIYGFVVANNTVRVLTVNQTGAGLTVPPLNMKVLQRG